MLTDLRYALRMLLKSPGFVLIAVLTLGVGIGSNTTVFSLVNSWLIHPIDFPKPDRLVTIWEADTKKGWINEVAPANFLDWRAQSSLFEGLSAWNVTDFDLSGQNEPERVHGAQVSANIFDVLGVQPVLGRNFAPKEDEPGGPRVVVLSHGFWQRRFASDPGVIGKDLTLGGEKFTVIGVMPKDFHFTLMGRAEMWMPLAFTEKQRTSRDNRFLQVIARMKTGATPQQAAASLAGVMTRLESQYPDTNTNQGVRLRTLSEEIGRHTGSDAILISFGVVACVLLIACANIANLMLARATGRQREVAVRLAIGAGRGQLMRQFLTENVLVFLIASLFGIALAFWGVDWIESSIPYENKGYLPHYAVLHVDLATLAYTLFIAIFTGILFGLAPALAGSKLDLNTSLKDGSRGSGGHSGQRMRKTLVAAEVALSVVVLIASGLLIRSFVLALGVEPGFDPHNIITARLRLPDNRYSKPSDAASFYSRIVDNVRSIPGVQSAAASQYIPYGEESAGVEFLIDGQPEPRPGEIPSSSYTAVTPGYFTTLKIPLIEGRFLGGQDGANSPKAVVVSDVLAKRYWPRESPIGKRIRLGRKSTESLTIVGVVRNVNLSAFLSGLEDRPVPQLYVPFAQAPSPEMSMVLRTTAGVAAIAPSLRDAVWSIDKEQPLGRVQTLDQLFSDGTKPYVILSQVMSFFALTALFLAAIGIYGVMAYAVSSRTQEFGIRMALGAGRRDVLKLVLNQGMRLVGVGMIVGLAASFAVSRTLRSLLFRITPTDPGTFGVMLSILIAVALLAICIPALRATRIDPNVALRHE
jgi:putative ABC transport system permease protein